MKKGIVLSRERHPVFPESSVAENLKIAGYLRKKPQIHEAMEYVFKLFPAWCHLRTPKAGFLSGGEQQMLAIGMSLVVKPELLLLDEPLLGLSPMMQKTLVGAIRNLKKDSGNYRSDDGAIRETSAPDHSQGIRHRERHADAHRHRQRADGQSRDQGGLLRGLRKSLSQSAQSDMAANKIPPSPL